MRKELVKRAMEAINNEQQEECIRFIPNLLALAFIKRYTLALEEALLELLNHSAGSPIQIPAYCALNKRYKRLSSQAQKKLEKFKKNKCNGSLIVIVKKQFGI